MFIRSNIKALTQDSIEIGRHIILEKKLIVINE